MSKIDSASFIFVHGYGNSPADFGRIQAFARTEGIRAEFLLLSGHENYDDDFVQVNWLHWTEQINSIVDAEVNAGFTPYLVGFSIGATLALDYASADDRVAGVVGIAPFLGFDSLRKFAIKMVSSLPCELSFKRNSAAKKLKPPKSAKFSERFNFSSLNNIQNQAERISKEVVVTQPVLLMHSTNDPIASFAEAYKHVGSVCERYHLMRFHDGGHFLPLYFDPRYFFDVVCGYFDISSNIVPIEENTEDYFMKEYDMVSVEHRFWSDILFKLLGAFFVGMGALIYNTLPKVLDGTKEGSYYVLSYWTIVAVYTILSTLYFFYTLRTQHFLVDYFPYINFHRFKVNKFMSGRMSSVFTRNTAFSIIVIPQFVSIFCIFCLYFIYRKDFYISLDNALRIGWLITNVILTYFAVSGLFKFSSYEKVFIKMSFAGSVVDSVQTARMKRLVMTTRRVVG